MNPNHRRTSTYGKAVSRPRVIELGVLPASDPEPPDSAWWGHRRMPPRAYLAAALVAAVLLLTGAAAAPAPPWPIPHFTVEARSLTSGIYLTEDTLLVSERISDRQIVMTAYRLTDGAVRWDARGTEGYIWDGIPVIWEARPGGTWQTKVYDPVTGRVLWQGAGSVAEVAADRLLIVHDRSEPPATETDEPRLPQLRIEVVDRYTGETVRRLDRVRQWGISDPPTGPATLVIAADGQPVTTYDLATGEVVATAPGIDLSEDGALVVAGDVLLVQPRAADPAYTAYDARTLAPRWRGDPQIPIWSVQPCGPVLCVHHGRLAALDPATGEQVWAGREFPIGYLAYQPGPPWLSDYLVVEHQDPYLARRLPLALVRARTGEVVAEFPGWTSPTSTVTRGRSSASDAWARHTDPILQRYVPASEMRGEGDAGRQRVRPAPPPGEAPPAGQRTVQPGRTWFARLRFDPPRLEVLGSVDSGLYGCQALGDYVACAEVERVVVWRSR